MLYSTGNDDPSINCGVTIKNKFYSSDPYEHML